MNKEIENKLNRWLEKADLDAALRTELEGLTGTASNDGTAEKESTSQTGTSKEAGVDVNAGDAVKAPRLQAKELEDRFYKDLEFGTGGLRGMLGAGTNRLNIYTVRKATQGIADYIKAAGLKKSVAVSYDSRINSQLFAENTAGVMLANGINVFMYDELMPAPALSFATRHHDCSIGIMITASHNPKDYNGYKVYNGRGCQVTLEQADDILNHIEKTDIFDDVKYTDITNTAMPAAANTTCNTAPATLTWMADETKEAYLNAVMQQSLGIPKSELAELKIAYTPLNGAGNKPVREMLHRLGVKEENIHVVAEQEKPDGNFPTCPYPNPEKKEALEKGIVLCEDTKSDILIATDPDSDRLGLAVRVSTDSQSQIGDTKVAATNDTGTTTNNLGMMSNDTGTTSNNAANVTSDVADCQVKILTGNEVGLLMLDFVCSMRRQQMQSTLPSQTQAAQKQSQSQTQAGQQIQSQTQAAQKQSQTQAGQQTQNPVIVRTMVTSRMTDAIAASYGINVKTTLTGFKFIGELIGDLEDEGRENDFVFGFEESCGYLSGTYVRDKDGVNAALLACEMAAHYKARGITLAERMEQLYEQYGYCQNSLLEFTLKGADGMKKMTEIMASFRNDPPVEIIGIKVISKADYMKQEIYIKGDCSRCDLVAGTKPTGLPKSDVMEFGLANGTTFTVRPSGTEPKLKIYIFAQSKSKTETQKIIDTLKQALTARVESI